MVKVPTEVRGARSSLLPIGEDSSAVFCRRLPGLTPYEEAVDMMERAVLDLSHGQGCETMWLLEHPPLYTAGTSARDEHLVDASRLPVFRTGRGGEFTYHGPGQRVVYLTLNLKNRREDVRAYVRALETWIIDALEVLGVAGERRDGRVGIWVRRPEKGPDAEDKIAAIGIRVRKWITYHGISINVAPDLSHYGGIVPCGISDHGVTSLAELGGAPTMAMLDAALLSTFPKSFGALEIKGG